MARIEWGKKEDRVFQHGVEKGVLYVDGESAVPWNGLISVSENPIAGDVEARYQDGIKTHNYVPSHEFEAEISAYTYPDVFEACLGFSEPYPGVFIDEQNKKIFGLSYQTGRSYTNGESLGNKIHLVYNAIATPNQRVYETSTDIKNPTPFSWGIKTYSAITPGFRPSSHFILDVDKAKQHIPRGFDYLYDRLYGSSGLSPRLLYPKDILDILGNWPILYPSPETYPSLDTIPGGP